MAAEFWAAIAGAIIGALAAGGIAWLLQWLQEKRQLRDRNRALAHSLIFKLIKIHSDLDGLRKHVANCAATAKEKKLPDGWQSLRAIGNLPGLVSFSPEEMSYLLSLKNPELFNKVLALDVLHASTIRIFELYAARRTALLDTLPASMQGLTGRALMNQSQFEAFAPKAAELESLARDIRDRVDQDSKDSREALLKTIAAVAPTLDEPLKFKLIDD